MSIFKHLTTRKSLLFMVIGAVAFVVYLYFFIGLNNVASVVRRVDVSEFIKYYLLAIATMLVVMLCWATSWKTLLKAMSVNLSLRKAFPYYWAGDFVDLVVPCPGVCGEATRVYLVHSETHESYGAIAAAGVTNRIISYTVVTAGLLIGFVYLLISPDVPVFASGFVLAAWIAALGWLSILLSISLSERATKKLASALVKILKTLRIRRYSEGLSPKTLRRISKFSAGFRFFRKHPRYLILPFIFQSLSFFLNLLVYTLVFYSLGSLGFGFLPFDFFIVVYFVAGAVQDAAASFSVGGLEIILTNIFIFYGIAPAESGVAAAVLRTVIFWFPLIMGYIIIQVIGARKLLDARTREAAELEQEMEKEKAAVPSQK